MQSHGKWVQEEDRSSPLLHSTQLRAVDTSTSTPGPRLMGLGTWGHRQTRSIHVGMWELGCGQHEGPNLVCRLGRWGDFQKRPHPS